MKILVTGRAGSGKSAIARELFRRNYTAFDTDKVSGLSQWVDSRTGQLATVPNDATFVDLERFHTEWNAAVLKRLLSEQSDVFICGSSWNDLSFEDLFDHHFVLRVSPETQIHRLQTRTDNNYGKDPRMHGRIIAMEREHVAAAEKLGAIVIDADLPIEKVVDTILAAL